MKKIFLSHINCVNLFRTKVMQNVKINTTKKNEFYTNETIKNEIEEYIYYLKRYETNYFISFLSFRTISSHSSW